MTTCPECVVLKVTAHWTKYIRNARPCWVEDICKFGIWRELAGAFAQGALEMCAKFLGEFLRDAIFVRAYPDRRNKAAITKQWTKLTVLLPLKSGKLEKKGTETSRLFPISLTIPLETAGGMIEMIWQSGANLIVKVRKRCDKYVAICTLSLFTPTTAMHASAVEQHSVPCSEKIVGHLFPGRWTLSRLFLQIAHYSSREQGKKRHNSSQFRSLNKKNFPMIADKKNFCRFRAKSALPSNVGANHRVRTAGLGI